MESTLREFIVQYSARDRINSGYKTKTCDILPFATMRCISLCFSWRIARTFAPQRGAVFLAEFCSSWMRCVFRNLEKIIRSTTSEFCKNIMAEIDREGYKMTTPKQLQHCKVTNRFSSVTEPLGLTSIVEPSREFIYKEDDNSNLIQDWAIMGHLQSYYENLESCGLSFFYRHLQHRSSSNKGQCGTSRSASRCQNSSKS